MARPSKFSQGTADTICRRLMEGESLRRICRDDDMPSQSAVFRWLTDAPSFREQYAHARDVQADSLADEILDISDGTGGDAQRDRLRVDARKWLAGKLAPKKYGDKLEVEHAGGFSVKRDLSDDELANIAAGSGAGAAGSAEGPQGPDRVH